jgi:hypothetical protein
MSHPNAVLTPEGRRRLCLRIDAKRPICHVADEVGLSRKTVGYWYARWVEHGEDGLIDGSSRPHRSPNQTPVEVEEQVCRLRRELKVGPVQLVAELAAIGVQVPAATIHRILVRHGISRLRDLDVSGEDLREPVRRYEYDEAGAMVHIDVKKLGRIPPGGGHRIHPRGSAAHREGERARHATARVRAKNGTRGTRVGYVYLHTAIDDHSRLAYTEELLDEKGTTAAGFWARAVKFFRRHGITKIHRVLSDNGACYRSLVFAAALARTRTRHHRTRPYRPQTNGKVERYHRTLASEWAYRQAWDNNEARSATLEAFLDRYNYVRGHTALKGRPPVTRTPNGVTNLAG